MKKAFPYILGAVVLILLVVMMTSNATKPPRRMDERVTLRQSDRIPYGLRVANELLPSLFPAATIYTDRKYPGRWDSIDVSEGGQAVILVADYFDADDDEVEELSAFVENGNYVFIIHRAASDDVISYFDFSYNNDYAFYTTDDDDSLKVKLIGPAFTDDKFYTYPGKKYDGSFYKVDTSKTAVLGRTDNGLPNFIQLDKGGGSFFLHSAPLAFSNYFILHKNNVGYYEQALSVLPKNIRRILWNEYYLEKPRNPKEDNDPNWLRTLFSYPSFKWGLLIGAFTLALFVLLGMRRRQRMIPLYEKPKNDSLDFVKTLGRLYYDRRDHRNLALKMAAYFLEHVRSKYKLPTHTLNEEFVQSLHYKSGYSEAETRNIITAIHTIQTVNFITDTELADFHKQLELFYQNT
jgi:hypothetical protein